MSAKEHLSLRVATEDLAEIDRRAAAHGYPNRTTFLLSLALSDHLAQTADEKRFEDYEQRLRAVEELVFRIGE